MNRICTLAWLLLIGLTVITYLLADGWSGGGTTRISIILAMAGIKFSVVAWIFMELRLAPRIWASALLVVLATILCAVGFLG
jgi:heme/copper-type cytochrome/quinol oxidase subunit 4